MITVTNNEARKIANHWQDLTDSVQSELLDVTPRLNNIKKVALDFKKACKITTDNICSEVYENDLKAELITLLDIPSRCSTECPLFTMCGAYGEGQENTHGKSIELMSYISKYFNKKGDKVKNIPSEDISTIQALATNITIQSDIAEDAYNLLTE